MVVTAGYYRMRFADGSTGLVRLARREVTRDGVTWYGEVAFPDGYRRPMAWREDLITYTWTPAWIQPATEADWLLALLTDATSPWEDER